MRKFVTILMTLSFLFLAVPAQAETEDLVNGLNGVATAPLDPIRGLIDGDPDILPSINECLDAVTSRVAGVVVGTLKGAQRALTGAFDAMTFWITDRVGGPYVPEAELNLLDAVAGLAGDSVDAVAGPADDS